MTRRQAVTPFTLTAALVALLCLVSAPRAAESGQPMSAAEFEAYSTGKTLYYGYDGIEYGIEQYLPGRRVRWSALDGECLDGTWYERGRMICFVYEGKPEHQCWFFFRTPGGIMARYANQTGGGDLYETRQSNDPLLCRGPEVGV